LRKIMDRYNHPHLLGCNYSQILERDKHLPMMYMNSFSILPSLKE
ncbi:18992_t:CDS:1, partial [Racocetra fulgida]